MTVTHIEGQEDFCRILVRRLTDCDIVPTPPSSTLTPEELKACQCELLAYTTALNEVEGITVSGGPPYVCGDVDCRQKVLTPIPTLSEWGLISLAVVLGILGLVGFMVMRRRKVSA